MDVQIKICEKNNFWPIFGVDFYVRPFLAILPRWLGDRAYSDNFEYQLDYVLIKFAIYFGCYK